MIRSVSERMKLSAERRHNLIRKLIYRKLFPLPDLDRQAKAIDQIKRAIRRQHLEALTELSSAWKEIHDSRSTSGNTNNERNAS